MSIILRPNISILLPAFKSESFLEQIFLKGYKQNTSTSTELIVYDNGGNGDLYKTLVNNGIKTFLLLSDGKNNVGLNAALNECAKVATGNYFYLPHCDMFLLKGWDVALLNVHKNIPPGQALLCSRSIEKASHTPFHILKDFGQTPEDFREKELLEFFRTYTDKGIVSGYRMPYFLSRKLWDRMGGVDPQFFSYATDNDLFFSAYEVGVRRFWLVQNSVVYHLSGRSNKQQNVDRDNWEPYRRLILKWKKYGVDANIDASEQRLVPWNVKVR